MLAGLAPNALAAFEMFACKRSKITKGVTQASQKRSVFLRPSSFRPG